MASGSQALSKIGANDGAASRERTPGSVGALHPSRGAEDMYGQACTLFRAMVQMPHYKDEVRTSLPAFGCRICATTGLPVQSLKKRVARFRTRPHSVLELVLPAMKATTHSAPP